MSTENQKPVAKAKAPKIRVHNGMEYEILRSYKSKENGAIYDVVKTPMFPDARPGGFKPGPNDFLEAHFPRPIEEQPEAVKTSAERSNELPLEV